MTKFNLLDAVRKDEKANGYRFALKNTWVFECYDKNGKLKWKDGFENIVVDVGLDDILESFFNGSGYTATHYIGLKDTGSIVAGDTMSSHVGWTTITPYSDGSDPIYDPAAASGESITNAASKAVFNIDQTDEVFGAFLKTDNTKGGTAGILFGGGDFSASRGVADGDTLNVTVVCTAASA